jgi:hypothetical protein
MEGAWRYVRSEGWRLLDKEGSGPGPCKNYENVSSQDRSFCECNRSPFAEYL